MSGALDRVAAALVRAEEELPRLAAPDGTVAVRIEDLREVLNTHSSSWQDELAEVARFIVHHAIYSKGTGQFLVSGQGIERLKKALPPLPSSPSGET